MCLLSKAMTGGTRMVPQVNAIPTAEEAEVVRRSSRAESRPSDHSANTGPEQSRGLQSGNTVAQMGRDRQ
jgi:hypothetical protein